MTTNFRPSETECKCGCKANDMQRPFMDLLESLRRDLDRPLYLTSAFRCEEHNKAVGGSPRSYHKKGRAADIVCETAHDRYTLVGSAIKLGFGGIGIYKTFIHVDDRGEDFKRIWSE
jgi:uncharacterized protein YcbK (DUF882 family)